MAAFTVLNCSADALSAAEIHKIVIQVNDNDPKKLDLALSNASNINKYYLDKGEEAIIEIVAYGPGLHMFRTDTSPVISRVKSVYQSYDNISFKACHETVKSMQRKEAKEIPLESNVQLVPYGIVYIIQLQEQGWIYIKP
jgi:intracellular sulfur oxidation DsrE/DsrF family protein